MIEEETSQLDKLDAESEIFTAVHLKKRSNGRNKSLMEIKGQKQHRSESGLMKNPEPIGETELQNIPDQKQKSSAKEDKISKIVV